MHVQQEELPCCRCTGILGDQLLSCKVMYKLRCRDSRETEHALYFCTGKASWAEPSLGALKTQKLSAYKKCYSSLAALDMSIPGPYIFSDTMFPLHLAEH